MTTLFFNTLYVTTPEAKVSIEGECLRVRVGEGSGTTLPLHHLSSVVCFGEVYITPHAMLACAEVGIGVSFLSPTGRFLARVDGPAGSTVLLRRAQYRAADDPRIRIKFAKSFVAGKVANSRTMLKRAERTRVEGAPELAAAAERLLRLLEIAVDTEDAAFLLGIEGEAAQRYFGVFDIMLNSETFKFEKRSRQPPENEVNALLSFGYAILNTDCMAALQAVGLDPVVGFLHVARPARPSLALDLMEEFRAAMVDKMVLAMIRLGQFTKADFEPQPSGAVLLSKDGRKKFLTEYQTRKSDPMTHPVTLQTATWGAMPHFQARLLAKALREDIDYMPFGWK